MQQISTPKDTNEESILLTMQLPPVTQNSINQFINCSENTKSMPIIKNQLNTVLLTSNADKSIDSRSNMIIPTINDVQTSTLDLDIKTITKVPVLKITINKRYNKRFVPNIDQNMYKLNAIKNKEKSKCNIKTYSYVKNGAKNISLSSKPVMQNVVPAVSKKSTNYKNATVETRNVYTPKFAFTRKGDLSRYQSRARTSAERIHYLYTKTKRDCHMLRMRLKALRERYLREKKDIQKLRSHLRCHYKNDTRVCVNKLSEGYLKRNKFHTSLKDTEEEEEKDEEYEKLLKKVRKIKQDISNNEILISEDDCFETILIDT